MSLDQATVKRIATLARLKLEGERVQDRQNDLNRILQFVDQLNEVNTAHVEGITGVNIPAMPFREDIITDKTQVQKILANAPEQACNMFVVPKVVE